ncbi:MAG: NAD(P)-binding protein [Micromonosporaceae bacterium]|nr:NAD(P)-binding protein [Micromonosporaceae bacterium]
MRVVVVGAGLAGLTAADDLAAAGADLTVLEARDRVGGRTHGIEVAAGSWVDAGGAYLGDRHTRLHALLSELGLKTTPTTMTGASRFALDAGGQPQTRPGRFPPLRAVALGELFDRLDQLATAVRVDAPWLTPDAATLDSLTAAQWAEQNLPHRDARRFFPLFLGELMAADPATVSLLHVAFYLRSGGGAGYLNAFQGGAQQDRVDGGAHQLCQLLAGRLGQRPRRSGRLGQRLRLAEPVRAIHQDGAGATVHAAGGAYHADAVVVAVPPLLADAIEFRPELPVRRAGERTGRGCAVKVHLVYPAPLWREHGLSGWSLSTAGPLLSTVDDSPPDGAVGVLTGFVTGAQARQFAGRTAAAQQAAVRAQAAHLFPQLPPPISVHITDRLTAQYSRGCYAALFGPGDWTRRGPHLTTPHHWVHWAGTETSTEFFGLMEGAVRSGHRAATEILSRYQPAGRSQ